MSFSEQLSRISERVTIFFLIVYAMFAPHSIAVTQGSVLLGGVAWVIGMTAGRKWRQAKTPVDIALFGFFLCCIVSSVFSFEPLLSLNGLRSPAFFLTFYYVYANIKSLRFAYFLSLLVVVSCTVNTFYSGYQLYRGRGVRIDRITNESPLLQAYLRPGDVILEADGQKVKTAEDISRIVDANRGRLALKYTRKEEALEISIFRRIIKEVPGEGTERLGIDTSPGRSFRVTGFYSHYETYAEILSMLGALGFGLFVAVPKKKLLTVLPFAAGLGLITIALIFTSTRSALAGLALSAFFISCQNCRRHTIVAVALLILVLVPATLITIERSRGIPLFDPNEGSAAYRIEMWREALRLVEAYPILGIGKGSESGSVLKEKFGLYDNGRLPPGHFHSTPIQIAVWWGLPALAFYVVFMTIFMCEAARVARKARITGDYRSRGIALGVMGALIAYNVNSLVQSNFIDGEVVMALWLLTGICFAVRRIQAASALSEESTEHTG